MPFLPLNQKLFANVDEIGNAVAITKRIDILRDDLGNNEPRFRLKVFADLGTGARVDGVFRPKNVSHMMAVSGGKLFKVSKDGTIKEITGAELRLAGRASMADFGDTAYICNNSKINKWVLDEDECAPLTDTDAPEKATRVGFFDQYLLASIDGSQRFEWSDVGLPDVWLGEFSTAAERPDQIVGLYTGFGEIFLPGTDTLEYWSDTGDALNPFGKLSGTSTERGVLAPDSVALVDNTYFFLDQERRVIRLEGRAPKVISNSIDRELRSLSAVSDAIGFGIEGQAQTLYVLTFPSAGVTWAYNYKTDDWSQFSFWEDAEGVRETFLASSAVFNPNWNKTILGSRKFDGILYEAVFDQNTDNNEPVRGELVTGRIDYGSPEKKKRCVRLNIKIKRGTSGLTGDDSVFYYYRDNGTTDWGTAIELKLGAAGDEYSYIPINRLGTYRDRQHRFILPSVDTVLVSAEETIEVER